MVAVAFCGFRLLQRHELLRRRSRTAVDRVLPATLPTGFTRSDLVVCSLGAIDPDPICTAVSVDGSASSGSGQASSTPRSVFSLRSSRVKFYNPDRGQVTNRDTVIRRAARHHGRAVRVGFVWLRLFCPPLPPALSLWLVARTDLFRPAAVGARKQADNAGTKGCSETGTIGPAHSWQRQPAERRRS